MDNFAEHLVKKQITKSERMKNMMVLMMGMFMTLLMAAAAVLMMGHGFFSFIFLIIAVGAGVGTFFLYRKTQVEYEYTFTNGELDIDKIIAQAKRSELLTVNVSKFTALGKYDDDTPEETEDMTVVMATDNIASHEFYADFTHEQYGSTRLVFCPDERMLSNIKLCLHPSVKNKVRDLTVTRASDDDESDKPNEPDNSGEDA